MTTLKLHNTATRRKEVFTPLDPRNVRMYVCGPTVYDRAHLGNARPVVVFDTLFRLLRHVYGADHVTYVRNFTDVDDKINAEALRRQQAGAPGTLEELIHQRTEETIGWYHADMDALGALRPAIRGKVTDRAEPRATAYIAQMIAMIETLMAPDETGTSHAYEREGHVLFRVRSYRDYGKLSGRSVDDMIAGARVEVAPFKEDPMDFVLWKPSSGDEPGWPSPWGRGRPGWHIECSAMAHELLGPAFDIHGGGIDLQFPHHENEIAQSRCAHPHDGFAQVWMHNEMLQVEGKKMSKSLGNFFTVRDLLDQGIPGEVIRFVLLGTHYSKPMDWTAEKARQAEATLWKWAWAVYDRPKSFYSTRELPEDFLRALSDDLNTAEAIACLHRLYKTGTPDALFDLQLAAEHLGIDLQRIAVSWPHPETDNMERVGAALLDDWSAVDRIELVIEARKKAKGARDFKKADLLRADLESLGVILKDTASGTEWSTSAKLSPEEFVERVRSFFADPTKLDALK